MRPISDATAPAISSSRPDAEFALLHQALATSGTEQTFHPQDKISVVQDNKRSLYLFSEGHFTFVRASDGLVLTAVRGGLIYGIAECLRPRGGWFLRVEETCTARVIPAEEAFELFTQRQLWEPVAHILAWFIQIYSLREEHLVGVTAYVMVRTKLLELAALPPEVLSGINVAEYIQKRTQLALSTIMAILGQLRRGDYIEIKRGKLVSINLLPKEY